METETLVMSTSRKRMVLKPFSTASLKNLDNKSTDNTNNTNERIVIHPPAELLSPSKKKILLQENVLPDTPTVQRNRVLLSYSANKNLADTDDSDSDESSVNSDVTDKSQKSNRKLYYFITGFLCWAAIQYWMIAVAGFGAVFFAVSLLIAIYFSTSTSERRRNIMSAYSVFNPQCTPIYGSPDSKNLERELIFGGL